ncbi:MAG: ABC transporter permease [Rikenellaceae bacterium]|jgi:lipoprotein-releasing system permease protein|nr:ABC transporter permease [Rikenellaceae bacterium]
MPRLPLLFAKRYLLSRKSFSVINLITGISAFTVAIPVMAMVVLLSVFNGLDGLIRSMYKNFDPDLKIAAVEGKTFDSDTFPSVEILAVEGVEGLSFELEENALFEYRGQQFLGTILGVDDGYEKIVPINSMIVQGAYAPILDGTPQATVGLGVAYELGVALHLADPLAVYMPSRGAVSPLLPMSLYKELEIAPGAVFALDHETDGQYVIVPIGFARELLDHDSTRVSAAIVRLAADAPAAAVQEEVTRIAGQDFSVLNRYQQKEGFYRIMQYEKWGIYFIILMVLVIASFSIVGSLVMIIIDKRGDIATLGAMGAPRPMVRRIFLNEGLLISGIGAAAGLAGGIALCLLQQQFGWVKMAGTSFLIDTYPVEIQALDIVGIVVSVGAVNFLMARFTIGRMIPKDRTFCNFVR